MAAKNRIELKQFIRFQLAQMGARNEQHLWEAAAYELARQRISKRLLPATGPVQAGGDQGRDFETYRTYLHATFGARAWTGLEPSPDGADHLVFACTLDKRLPAKIKADLSSIFGGGERPTHVYYFAEQDLPVAKRHKLQAHCLETYSARLEIFDGAAVADMLADGDAFWIAEQFFAVPTDFYPLGETDKEYTNLRTMWFKDDSAPNSHADFVEISRALRRSLDEEDTVQDFPRWLTLMRDLEKAADGTLSRKALYEVAFTLYRAGRAPEAASHAARLLSALPDEATPLELEHATTIYSISAVSSLQGIAAFEKGALPSWKAKLNAAIQRAMATENRASVGRYRLLLSRSQMGVVDLVSTTDRSFEGVIADWSAALAMAEQNVFCDIGHFAKVIEEVAPLCGELPTFSSFVDQFDALIARREGGAADVTP